MSGGSYGYLATKDAGELFQNLPYQLTEMRDRLAKTYPGSAAHHDTHQLIVRMENMLHQVSETAAELEDVWHAIEWSDSGDWSEEDACKAIEKYAINKHMKGIPEEEGN